MGKNKISSNKSLGKILLIAMLVVALLASFYLIYERHKIEAASKNVEILVDWSQVCDIALLEGSTPEKVLEELQPVVTGVLFKEDTIKNFTSENKAYIIATSTLLQNIKDGLWQDRSGMGYEEKWNYIICADKEIQQQIYQQLLQKTYAKNACYELTDGGGNPLYVVGTSYTSTELNNIGLGFLKDNLNLVSSMGYKIVVQIRTWPKVNQDSINMVFDSFNGYPIISVVFNDSTLPGNDLSGAEYSAAYHMLADAIIERGLAISTVEFFSQSDISTLARLGDYNVLRMHSISEQEMLSMSQKKAVDRFQLAASERNMSLLFVRFFIKKTLSYNIEYLQAINNAMAEEGLTVGNVTGSNNFASSSLMILLVTLGVAAGGILLCQYLGLGKISWVLGILGFLGVIFLLFVGQTILARRIVAFLAAVIFPVLAISYNINRNTNRKENGRVLLAIWRMFSTTLISLVGAALIIGALADKRYMLAINYFSGVKVAAVLPLLLLAYIFWRQNKNNKELLSSGQELIKRPLTIGLAIAGLVALAIVALYVLRTGNDSGATSSIEETFRSWLSAVMGVRPRTKELLLHPLLFLIFYFGYNKKLLPILLLTSIAQVSLVNTFCHIHTPMLISLERTFLGLVIGIIIGIVLLVIIKVGQNIWQKEKAGA